MLRTVEVPPKLSSASDDNLTPSRWKLRRRLYSIPLILLLLPFAIVLVLCMVEALAGIPLRATGDPLFDTYARAVRNRQWWQFYHGNGQHPATLPDAQLARWESRFGNDPRYWELRYYCAVNRDQKPLFPDLFSASTERHVQSIDLLERATAIKGSVAAYHRLQRTKSSIAYSSMDMEGEGSKADIAAELARIEATDLQLLEVAIADNPDSAWSYYNLAFWYFQLGDWDEAFPLLEKARHASEQSLPRIFPLSFVYSKIEAGVIPGSARVAGAIMSLDRQPNFIPWSQIGNELIVGSMLGGDIELWQSYHDTVCSWGMHATDVRWAQAAAALSRRMPIYLLIEDVANIDHHQRARLYDISYECQGTVSVIQAYRTAVSVSEPALSLIVDYDPLGNSFNSSSSPSSFLIANSSDPRVGLWTVIYTVAPGEAYRLLPHRALREANYLRTAIQPRFVEWSHISYSELLGFSVPSE